MRLPHPSSARLPRLRNTRLSRGGAAWAALALLCLSAAASAQETNPTTAGSAVYVRTDSDETTVVTPRVHVGVPLAEESRLNLVYTVDVWSSASIDIRTAASKRVVEQRDEIDVSAEHRIGDAVVGGSYRYSTEYDYESHGGSIGASHDLANKSANVALTLKGYFDRVGRAGDPDFDRATSTLSARAGFTQLLDADTYVQGIYELTRQDGYLSSPYRFVRFAGSVDELPRTCMQPVRMCLPENNPDGRLRHAFAVSARHALSWELSLGAGYRFYIDDWEMGSHTINVDGALSFDPGWLFSLGYRFYAQSSAAHYAPFYLSDPIPAFYTSDKELSSLMSHRVDLELSRDFQLDELGSQLRAILLVAPGFYAYDDFPLLDSISALELTLAMEMRL